MSQQPHQFNRAHAIVHAVNDLGMTVTEASRHFRVSRQTIYNTLARYQREGTAGLQPRSTAPHTTPQATSQPIVDQILHLRDHLTTQGHDAGAITIHTMLDEDTRPSVTTIWRILKRNGCITPEPKKRPKSSYIRFQASLPNETWQSDVANWPLADGTTAEIITWLDDHSRFVIALSAHTTVTVTTVVDTFLDATSHYGIPQSTLTDNGRIYTARFSLQSGSINAFESLLAQLGVTQKNGKPHRPTTQGKVERWHQTLKRKLKSLPPIQTIEELNHHLSDFREHYNNRRPHQSLGRKTPASVYTETKKYQPAFHYEGTYWRIRTDRVASQGTVSLRHSGRLRHLAIGRAHAGRRVIILVEGPHTVVIDQVAKHVLARHIIDPTVDYQKKSNTDHFTPKPSPPRPHG